MSWWVLSVSPLGLAEVMAKGPVMSMRWTVTVWSGTRIMMLSLVPTRSYPAPTPEGRDTGEGLDQQDTNVSLYRRHESHHHTLMSSSFFMEFPGSLATPNTHFAS